MTKTSLLGPPRRTDLTSPKQDSPPPPSLPTRHWSAGNHTGANQPVASRGEPHATRQTAGDFFRLRFVLAAEIVPADRDRRGKAGSAVREKAEQVSPATDQPVRYRRLPLRLDLKLRGFSKKKFCLSAATAPATSCRRIHPPISGHSYRPCIISPDYQEYSRI